MYNKVSVNSFNKVCSAFADVLYFLEAKFENKAIYNKKIKSASSSIQMPSPFEPFVNIIKFNSPNLIRNFNSVTKDEVLESDQDSLKRFGKFNLRIPYGINKDILFRAAAQATADLGIYSQKHEMMSFEDSCESFSKNTNSGFPYYGRKNDDDIKAKVISDAYDIYNNLSIHKIFTNPSTVFHRFQSKNVKGDIKVKIRQVWGEPYVINVLSGRLFRHLINNVKTYCLYQQFPATTYGRSLTDISDNIISEWRKGKTLFASIDIFKQDQSISTYFWPLFLICVEPSLNFSNYKDKRLFKLLIMYYCFTPYCYRSNVLQFQKCGNSSGSLITSLFATWVVRVIVNYIFMSKTDHSASFNSINLGDDNLIRLCTNRGIDLTYVIKTYELFGFTIPKETCDVYHPDCKSFQFLGYLWDTSNRPTQTKEWFIVHFCYPQRFFRDNDIPVPLLQTYRAISIAAPLYNGLNIFIKHIGKYDKIFKHMVKLMNEGKSVEFRYFGEDQRLNKLRLPLDNMIKYGWRYYNLEADVLENPEVAS